MSVLLHEGTNCPGFRCLALAKQPAQLTKASRLPTGHSVVKSTQIKALAVTMAVATLSSR